jgi:hypothetical protein
MARGNKQMTVMLDDTVADPWQIIADLQQKLDASTAELSEAQERETATAEILEISGGSPGAFALVAAFDQGLSETGYVDGQI